MIRCITAIAVALVALVSANAQVVKESVPGIANMARLETTVACAGAITADSVPAIKKMGFASIVNLRLATEQRRRQPRSNDVVDQEDRGGSLGCGSGDEGSHGARSDQRDHPAVGD